MSVVTWMSVVGLEINEMDGCFFCKEDFFFSTQLCFVGCNIENLLGKHPVHTYIYSCMCTDPLPAHTHARAHLLPCFYSRYYKSLLIQPVPDSTHTDAILSSNILLWIAVHPCSSYFLRPLAFSVISVSKTILHCTSSSVQPGRLDTQLLCLSCLILKWGIRKMCSGSVCMFFGNILPSLLPNGTFVVSSVNWKLAPVSEPWRLKSRGSTYLKWLRRICYSDFGKRNQFFGCVLTRQDYL